MSISVSWQTFLTLASISGAALAMYKYVAGVVRWVDAQKKQSEDIEELKKSVSEKEKEIIKSIDKEKKIKADEVANLRAEVNNELVLVNYGLLACLKGLAEQGCDGPVHEAIEKIEKHLNQKAHS